MQKRLTVIAVAGAVGLGAVGVTALAYPALAANTPTPSATASPSPGVPAPDSQAFTDARKKAIAEQLKGLVSDGTLTQAQADKVAATLAAKGPMGFGGHGGFRGGPGFGGTFQALQDAAAKALGLTADQLHTQLESGSTIAEIAKKQNKDVATVTSTLTKAAQAALAQAVKDNKLTQAMADQLSKNLPAQVKAFVENGKLGGQFRMRGGPFGGRHGMDGGPGQAPGGSTPSPSATGQSSFFGTA